MEAVCQLKFVTETRIKNICRACSSQGQMFPLFGDLVFKDKRKMPVAEMFMSVTEIEISETDQMPSNICAQCLKKLHDAYLFKISCQQINLNFLSLFKIFHNNTNESVLENSYKLIEEQNKKAFDEQIKINGGENNKSKIKTQRRKIEENINIDLEEKSERKTKQETNEFEKQKIAKIQNLNDNRNGDQHQTDYRELANKDIKEEPNIEEIEEQNRKRIKELINVQLESLKSKPRRKKPRVYKMIDRYCRTCKKRIPTEQFLKHMGTHVGEKRNKCTFCEKAFLLKSSLMDHIRTHTNERPFACSKCEFRCKKSWNLVVHMRRHTAQKEDDGLISVQFNEDNGRNAMSVYKCKVCDLKSDFKSLIRRHIIDCHNEKLFKCEQCPSGFVDRKRLQFHIRDVHEVHNKIYKCKICDKTFSLERLYRNHRQTHSNHNYLCNYCGKIYNHYGSFFVHLRIHTGEAPYKCLRCDKTFKQISTLRTHELTHLEIRPYKCTYCTSAFKNEVHLKNHLRTHTGERPYACAYCDKAFALKVNLTVHTRLHTGERPFKCTVCDRGFCDSSNLKRHMLSHGIAYGNKKI